MNKLLLVGLVVIQLNVLQAQISCDSTYAVCDSITIDSVLFTHNENGDRIHFKIRSDYQSVYAPIFRICPDDGNILFVDNNFDLFAIGGPSSLFLYYQFQNFDFSSDSISGEIVFGNSNDSFSICTMPFNVPTQSTTNNLNHVSHVGELVILPNPTVRFLTIQWPDDQAKIQSIHLMDINGRNQQITISNFTVDLYSAPPGLYILSVELTNGKSIRKKVIKH